jgi:acetyl/propionyl-CoA carboxylase alpha subunit
MHYRYQIDETIYDVVIEGYSNEDFSGYRAFLNGEEYHFEILDMQAGELSLRFDGRPIILYWAPDGNKKWISREGCTYLLEPPSSRTTNQVKEDYSEGQVRAPMPAQVRSIDVLEGDFVAKGDTLLLLEAMKMEIRVQAPGAGKVKAIHVKAGQAVEREQILVEITDEREKNENYPMQL